MVKKIQFSVRSLLLSVFFLTISHVSYAETSFTETPSFENIPQEELKALAEAYYQIKKNYVNEKDDSELLQAAIKGMVDSLDSHSRFLPPKEFEQFNNDNLGEYAGIGLSFNNHQFGIEVVEVIRNSPADRAGIKSGMLVTHIEEHEVKLLPPEKALDMLRGDVDTEVKLTVAAVDFPQPKDFKLRREIVLVESVVSQSLPERTGYIAISQFTMNSTLEFKKAINRLIDHEPLESLIIDLRDNPGGSLNTAIELSDLFVGKGKLLVSAGRTDDANQTYFASKKAPLKTLEVVVVVNGGSASASEIMAAALQDHKQALILGEQSYGKGSIQTVIALNETSGMKFTTAEYFSPSGRKIQGVGVTPDVKFEKPVNKNNFNVSLLDDPQLLQAYNLLKSN